MGKDLTYDDLEQIITDLKSEIAHYKTNEARARAIFDEFKQVAERLQCGIYRFNIKSRRFIFFNRVAIELLGSKESAASEITSKSVMLRIHPEDREMVRQAVKKSMAPGIASGEAEYRYRKSDGTYRWTYDRWVVLRDCSEQPCYIEGIVMDITERKKAEKAIKESEHKLRLLSSHLMKAQEKEWRRIALELHDELGQTLTVFKLQLRAIKKKLAQGDPKVQTDCEKAYDYVDQIIEKVRRLSHDLCPSCVEDLGLDDSIKMLIEEFAEHSKLNVSVNTHKIDTLFPLESKILIYRIFQEAFTNIQKHAQAHNVSVIIQKNKMKVSFQVADDGNGFDRESKKIRNGYRPGLGLTAMEERARMLGGTLAVYSIIGIGTRIAFCIPIKKENQYDESSLPYSFG